MAIERFHNPVYDSNVSGSSLSGHESNTFPSSHPPYHSQISGTFEAESPSFSAPSTPLDSYSGSFENLSSVGQSSGPPTGQSSSQHASQYSHDSGLPSFQDTYNIHGTYAYMRQEDIKPEFLGAFRTDDPEKYQYMQAFTDPSFLDHGFASQQSQDFPSYQSPDNKESVFSNFPHSSSPVPMFSNERGPFSGFQPGFYSHGRMQSSESFPYSPSPSAMFSGGRPPFQRRSSAMSLCSDSR